MIKEKLGAGAFGEVYKVESKEDGRIYAVKRSSQRFRGEWDRLDVTIMVVLQKVVVLSHVTSPH